MTGALGSHFELDDACISANLPVTPAIAKLWGRLCVQTGNKGIDNLIAATALCHNLTVVTRNVTDFEPTGVRVLNPFGSG